jgi:hypothetical protein
MPGSIRNCCCQTSAGNSENDAMKLRRYLPNICIALSTLCSLSSAQQQAASASSAVVPRLVNFSGKVFNAEGKTISGVAGVIFAIYQEQSGGAPLWIETQNVQADSNGSYTAQLGSTKPDGLPLDLFTSGAARWLGVTINGGEEQPRILLLSVPYALPRQSGGCRHPRFCSQVLRTRAQQRRAMPHSPHNRQYPRQLLWL